MAAARTFPRLRAAILACAAALFASGPCVQSAAAQATLPRPVEIRARLASGAAFTGKLESWDLESFSGSFGTKRWVELVAPDLRRIFTQVMDRKSAAQTLALAELLASVPSGAKLAEESFRLAKTLGATDAAIEEARTRGRGALAARAERDRMDRERRLQGAALPADSSATPWPLLTDADRATAVTAMRDQARQAMEVVGIAGDPAESEHFLLFGDLPKAEQQRWIRDLEVVYARVLQVLGLPKEVNLFWGKAVVLAFQKEDTFKVVEAGVFGRKSTPGLRGVCHMQGPKVFVSLYRGNDELQCAATLVHEMTHGIVYRYATALQMPDWANEGFAEWVARACVPQSGVDANRRPQGLAFFRQGGDASKVMALSGADGTWPGDNAIGYSVGFLLVDLMLAEEPQKFGAWVKAIKGGKPWAQALEEDFGVTPARLAQSAAAWYRTNDGVPRR